MDRVIRRRLANAPRLLTAYLVWINRPPIRVRRLLFAAFALSIFWAGIVSMYLRNDRKAAAVTIDRLHRHAIFLAAISAIVACVIVSRRRALERTEASRSWISALPVKRSTARWEALAIETAPALAMASALILAFAVVSMVVAFNPGISAMAPIATGLQMTAGAVLGTLVSYALPAAKSFDLPPGSRYVPHRRAAGLRLPEGSLRALGIWPVRQMFASARPRAVARATLPILLMVPMGSSADSAMLVIAMFTVIAALVLLVSAMASVSARGSRWLQPLPLNSSLLARILLTPALAVMFCAAVVEAWLLWVMGAPVARSLWLGALTLASSSLLAVAGSLVAIFKIKNGRR